MTQGTGEEGNKKAGLSGSQVKENVINEVEVLPWLLQGERIAEQDIPAGEDEEETDL